jgi:putative redox protein
MKPIAEATVRSTPTNYRHQITTGSHEMVADEPAHEGGGDAGPAPYQLYLSGLGACTAITLRIYAQKKGWDLGELRVGLELHKDADGNARIHRSLAARGALDETQWQRLLDVVERTPVTLTVKRGAVVTTSRAA